MYIISMTILVYDWMCTLDQEVSYKCLPRYKLVSWLTVFGVHLSEVILMLRTYAIWERRRGVLVFLILLFLGTAIPAAVFWQIELYSNAHGNPDTIWAYLMVGCSSMSTSSVSIIYVI
ncbi:hypothetical protein DFH09DRAFT_1139316 [Mycena vulgaris]|nr:hypothetical protein DFH09DRAFT_1139316 [Mycena vulgaris]